MHQWFHPICLIGRKSLHFEKTRMSVFNTRCASNSIDTTQPLAGVQYHINQWWIQDFPGGANLLFGQFPQKLHENEEILGQGQPRIAHLNPPPPVDPPMYKYPLHMNGSMQMCTISLLWCKIWRFSTWSFHKKKSITHLRYKTLFYHLKSEIAI